MRKPLVIIAVVLISLVIGILIWNNPGILHLKYTRSVQEDPVLKKVTESISNGKEYLLRTIDPELGGVHKYYYPKTGEFDRELTTTYTATTLYALQKISNNVRADPRIAEVTPKVVDFLFSMQNNDPDDRGYGGFQYSYDLVTGKKDSMYVSGTNSKTIFLMLYMYDLTGENKYLESAVKAGDFLLTLQMNNGTIVSYIKKDGEGHWYRSTEYSYLYNSESLSALSRLYARTGEQRFLDEADMIATKFALDINDSGCYVGDDYRVPNPISSAWLIMSMFDYFQVALDPDIKELVEECSLEMLDRQLTNESQKDYGRWREAYSTSANGWIMEVMSELHTYCVLNAEENCEKYMSAIRKANAWMEQRTYNGSNYYSDPGAVGGIIRYDDDWSIRTDSVAHTMTAYANAYGYLKENSKEDIGKNEIILYAVGDLVLDRGIERKVYEKGGGDYSFPFIPIRKKLDEADILFGNLESQMSDLSGIKADKLADNPVYFKAEEKAVSGLKYAGFDILSVANNHALDYGREVFLDSLRILDHAGIAYVGGGKDIQDSQLKVIESKGTRIGFIGYTYPRSDRVYASWEPGVVQSGVNVAEFDELEALSEAAADAKKKVDILIVSLHGGTQYTPEPDEYQRVVSEALIKGGADLIIGHHPLVVQPLVRYKSGWIAYSLGNFVFDRRDREHSSGVILEVTIAENRIRSLGYTGVQLTEDFQPALAGTAEETGAKPSFGFRWAPEALAAVIILLTLALYRETDFTEKPKKKGHFMIKAYRHAIRFISRYYFLLYIIAFLLLVRNDFSVLSLNHQEIDYLTISSKSAKDIIFNTYGDQLPVWFLLLKAYTAVFGFSQPILVAFSVFFFILAAWSFTWLAGIYRLNKALVAGLILFNPLLIMGVATLVKHWSFLMLLVGLTLFFYEKAKLQNRVRDYMYLGLTAAIGLYSNLIYIVFCFLLSIYVLFDFLKKRIDVKRFLVLAIALLLISSPLLLKINGARHQLIDVNGDRRYEKAKFLPTLIDELFVISGAYFFDLISFVSYSVLMLGIVIYGAFHQRRHRNLRMTFLLMLFIGMLVMSAFRQMTFFQWRYIGFLVPVFYLSFLVRDRNLFVRLMQYGMLLLTVTSSLYALNNDDNRSIVSYYGWKEVAQFICEQRASHAIVIYPLERLARQSIDYYTRELNLDNMPDIEYLSNSDQLDLHGNRIKIVTLLTDTTKIRDLGTMYRITEDKSLLPFSLFILDKSDGPEIMQFSPDSEGRQCLFIPQGANTTLQVQVPELMMQNKITFLAAINDSMITGYMSPVFIDFFIDGIWQDRLVHPDIRGWLEHDVSTAQYDQERHNLTLSISTDGQRRFCFGLGLSEELAEEFYFYDKLEKAEASVDNGTCRIFIEDPVWPHNEKKPPFLDSKIFGRWDCSGGKELWNAVGRSYAVSGGDFRYAIWFHPVENKTKSVIYALGGNALQRNALGRNISSIKGYFGFNDLSLSKGLKGADTFIIKLDNRTVFNETAAHKPGWSEFSIDIGSLVSTVEFVVKTTDDTWKHFFFNAYIEG